MDWSTYEVFSVLSGLIAVALGLTPDVAARERFWCLGGGFVLVAYGFFVASQESGTYYFPMIIFVLPVIGAAVIAVKAVERRKRLSKQTGEDGR